MFLKITAHSLSTRGHKLHFCILTHLFLSRLQIVFVHPTISLLGQCSEWPFFSTLGLFLIKNRLLHAFLDRLHLTAALQRNTTRLIIGFLQYAEAKLTGLSKIEQQD